MRCYSLIRPTIFLDIYGTPHAHITRMHLYPTQKCIFSK